MGAGCAAGRPFRCRARGTALGRGGSGSADRPAIRIAGRTGWALPATAAARCCPTSAAGRTDSATNGCPGNPCRGGLVLPRRDRAGSPGLEALPGTRGSAAARPEHGSRARRRSAGHSAAHSTARLWVRAASAQRPAGFSTLLGHQRGGTAHRAARWRSGQAAGARPTRRGGDRKAEKAGPGEGTVRPLG